MCRENRFRELCQTFSDPKPLAGPLTHLDTTNQRHFSRTLPHLPITYSTVVHLLPACPLSQS